MTLDQLKQLSDDDINRRVAVIINCEEGDEDDPPATWFFADDDYFVPRELAFAWSFDAIISAVRAWTNGDAKRKGQYANGLANDVLFPNPQTRPSSKGVLFVELLYDATPRDLCHALILADEQTKGS